MKGSAKHAKTTAASRLRSTAARIDNPDFRPSKKALTRETGAMKNIAVFAKYERPRIAPSNRKTGQAVSPRRSRKSNAVARNGSISTHRSGVIREGPSQNCVAQTKRTPPQSQSVRSEAAADSAGNADDSRRASINSFRNSSKHATVPMNNTKLSRCTAANSICGEGEKVRNSRLNRNEYNGLQ